MQNPPKGGLNHSPRASKKTAPKRKTGPLNKECTNKPNPILGTSAAILRITNEIAPKVEENKNRRSYDSVSPLHRRFRNGRRSMRDACSLPAQSVLPARTPTRCATPPTPTEPPLVFHPYFVGLTLWQQECALPRDSLSTQRGGAEMALLTAVLAGVAFVVVPFLAIALIFELGLAIGDACHWLVSHFHPL